MKGTFSSSSGNPLRPLSQLAANVLDNADKGLAEVGLTLLGEIKSQLSTKGRGRIYSRGKKSHQASAPGDPPARDQSHLINSAYYRRRGLLQHEVGVNAAGAGALEWGTTTAGKNRNVTIAPRPYMRPALAKVEKEMGVKIVSTLQRGTK